MCRMPSLPQTVTVTAAHSNIMILRDALSAIPGVRTLILFYLGQLARDGVHHES